MEQTANRLVTTTTRDQATDRRGSHLRRNVALAIAAAVIVLLAGYVSWSGGDSGGGAAGLSFTIPEGTYKNVATPGITSAVTIPTKITFRKGDDASITIVNNDVVDHRAGPFLVGAGQTYVQRFPEPGIYQINCSVDAAESITVTVEG